MGNIMSTVVDEYTIEITPEYAKEYDSWLVNKWDLSVGLLIYYKNEAWKIDIDFLRSGKHGRNKFNLQIINIRSGVKDYIRAWNIMRFRVISKKKPAASAVTETQEIKQSLYGETSSSSSSEEIASSNSVLNLLLLRSCSAPIKYTT